MYKVGPIFIVTNSSNIIKVGKKGLPELRPI